MSGLTQSLHGHDFCCIFEQVSDANGLHSELCSDLFILRIPQHATSNIAATMTTKVCLLVLTGAGHC